jgi:hypothetical protein
MKHFIATITFTANDDVDYKNVVETAADRMQECEGNVHIYDTHVEEETP